MFSESRFGFRDPLLGILLSLELYCEDIDDHWLYEIEPDS
jgi:hypothetical protein